MVLNFTQYVEPGVCTIQGALELQLPFAEQLLKQYISGKPFCSPEVFAKLLAPKGHFIGQLENSKPGTYFTPNPLKPTSKVQWEILNDTRDVAEYRTFWIEVDPPLAPASEAEADYNFRCQLTALGNLVDAKILPRPTAVVLSGEPDTIRSTSQKIYGRPKSVHIFWRSDKALVAPTWNIGQEDLIEIFGGDSISLLPGALARAASETQRCLYIESELDPTRITGIWIGRSHRDIYRARLGRFGTGAKEPVIAVTNTEEIKAAAASMAAMVVPQLYLDSCSYDY